jgi:hypothetical protein
VSFPLLASSSLRKSLPVGNPSAGGGYNADRERVPADPAARNPAFQKRHYLRVRDNRAAEPDSMSCCSFTSGRFS